MTYTELVAFLNTNVTPPVTDSQKLADNDKAVLDFLLNQNSDDFPDWTDGQTFNTDATGDGKYCKHPDTNGRKRIFETKTSGNTGNTPPTDPGVTENTHWIEISQSASASIPEYVPGVYGTGLKMVFFEDDIYKLQEPVRPFTSTNLLTELAAGKWLNLTRKRALVLATGDLDTTITQTGDYYCEAAVVNKPPGAFSGKGFLRAVVRDSQNQSQVFIPSEHFTLFYRRQNAGTWHGWKSVATLDDLVGLYDDRGAHDASVTKYPSTGGSGTGGAILKGDIWRINVAGNGLIVGQTVRALIDSPGTSDANWHVSVGGGSVGGGVVAFTTSLLFDFSYASSHTIVGANAFTLNSANAKIGSVYKLYLRSNGINKPTFSSDFVIQRDNWLNTLNTWNLVHMVYTGSGKVSVWITYQ